MLISSFISTVTRMWWLCFLTPHMASQNRLLKARTDGTAFAQKLSNPTNCWICFSVTFCFPCICKCLLLTCLSLFCGICSNIMIVSISSPQIQAKALDLRSYLQLKVPLFPNRFAENLTLKTGSPWFRLYLQEGNRQDNFFFPRTWSNSPFHKNREFFEECTWSWTAHRQAWNRRARNRQDVWSKV